MHTQQLVYIWAINTDMKILTLKTYSKSINNLM